MAQMVILAKLPAEHAHPLTETFLRRGAPSKNSAPTVWQGVVAANDDPTRIHFSHSRRVSQKKRRVRHGHDDHGRFIADSWGNNSSAACGALLTSSRGALALLAVRGALGALAVRGAFGALAALLAVRGALGALAALAVRGAPVVSIICVAFATIAFRHLANSVVRSATRLA
jgi:hypothetical protein